MTLPPVCPELRVALALHTLVPRYRVAELHETAFGKPFPVQLFLAQKTSFGLHRQHLPIPEVRLQPPTARMWSILWRCRAHARPVFHSTGRSPPGGKLRWQLHETRCPLASPFYSSKHWTERLLIGSRAGTATERWMCDSQEAMSLVSICLIRQCGVGCSVSLPPPPPAPHPQALVRSCPPHPPRRPSPHL